MVPARAALLLVAVGCCAALLAPPAAGSSLLSGFRDDVVISGLKEPTSLRFAPDGRVFVAEQSGRILVYDSLESPPTVFADLRTQVYDAGDRGLLGLALDPSFPERPYVYALYTYDHVLGEGGKAPKWGEPEHSGDACPKPEETDVDACPVSGRLVRLTAEGGGDHATENAEGEVEEDVLVEDWCQQFSSHSIGDLQFDSSGALYASGGDGASFYDADYGQFGWPQKNQCGDPGAAVGAEPSPPDAEGGALRSQDVRTPADPTGLDGSVIRVDPETGEGLPGNPMFGSLDANARRIVAYGFRNPYRFVLDPTSDEIYLGNVGWNTYEEIDRFPAIPDPAFNSGWPCYEGPAPNPIYESLELSLCESLYEEGSSAQPFFYYRQHDSVVPEDGCSTATGSAVAGLAFYEGGTFPPAYDGALFFADPIRGCIYVMFPGDDGRPDPLSTTTFMWEGGLYPGIDLQVGPEGALYYVKLFGDEDPGTIHRISYDPNAPVARLTASPRWGAAPLEVELDASGSSDPNDEPLSYEWDLDGNGSFETSGGEERTETFAGHENVEVAVRVSDGTSSNVARVTVYPDDTPPEPVIEEPEGSLTWGVGQRIDFSGIAEDGEDGELPDSDLYWKARLYHCPGACHAHPLQVFPAVDEGSFVAPDHDYPSHIEISLTATDSRGLSATRSVSINPRTVDLTIGSDPSGLILSAGLLSGTAPLVLRTIEGSHVVLAAPATGELSGQEYTWNSWSDGGARVHTIVADSPATYTAFYATTSEAPPPPPNPEETDKPKTELGHHPSKKTHSSAARFTFTSNEHGSRFRCKLDKGKYGSCHSPRVYRHLKPGKHVFRVVAVNSSGKADATPSTFRWRIL